MKNIESVVRVCDFDLHTHVMNWEDMKQLQLAYLRSGVANQDVPQDHAFFANLYHFAVQNKIEYVLSGGNIATEAIFPKSWHHSAMDATNLRAIYARFGSGRLKEYRTVSFLKYYLYYPFVRRMKVSRFLDYLPYIRGTAIKTLQEKSEWRPYGYKHGESVFTRFFQNYYLVKKFGYDKRKPHLSSLIVTGQMSRDDAIVELATSSHEPEALEEDIYYFRKKLSLSKEEFQQLMNVPARNALDFPSDHRKYVLMKRLQSRLEGLMGRRMSNYS